VGTGIAEETIESDMANESQKITVRRKRRWLQFSLRTLLGIAAVVCFIFAWPHMYRHYTAWRLGGYVGVNLEKLPDDEKKAVNRWIESLVGNEDFPEADLWPYFRGNSLIGKSSLQGYARLYIVQLAPTMSIPGTSYGRLYVLDQQNRVIRSTVFNIGYRAFPNSASFDESSYGFPCLVIETRHTWVGSTRQFYRISDDSVELMRSERLDGKLYAGHGNSFDLRIKPTDWTNWRDLLNSSERLAQLRGLAAFWSYDILEQRPIHDRALHNRLSELSKSTDSWIREESLEALKWIDERVAQEARLKQPTRRKGSKP
jgi:hypothetical protein